MCGITGIIDKGDARLDLTSIVERMTNAVVHRGPDGAGYHVDGTCALGHRRLSIIDVKGGQQPIYNEDRSVCVVFNGEIYNFAEIRKRLIDLGHVFRTNSDTETIVHAYESWGERCVEQFRGMFAFAIRDVRHDRLFLARDRFGKKPLFYAFYRGRFVFASEMKAILTDPAFDPAIDQEAVASFFTFSYIPAPLTIFKNIRKLLPGHVLTLRGDQICETPYWDLSYAPDSNRKESDFVEEIRHRLKEAVRMRLMSEVPLGAFLSGGVDSSAVVAYMAQSSSEPVNTFTMGFSSEEPFEDERPYARMVASRYRTNHREFEVTPRIADIIEPIIRSFDEPFADDSVIPSYYVCKIARENVTVALSGLGGDEAFCGYERYLGFRLSQWYNHAPAFLRSGAMSLVDAIPELTATGNRVNHIKRFVRSAVEDEARRYLGFVRKIGPRYESSLFAPQGRAHEMARAAVEERFLGYYRNANADNPLDRMFYCDVKTYLTDDILALTDRLSMCHSLEVRAPFLDHELFEFSATIPASMKLSWLRKKHLLKSALKDVVPAPILTHKKRGFVGPLPEWLRNELRSYVGELLSPRNLARHDLFDSGTVSRILQDHFEGRETNDTLIWSLVTFQNWYDLYIDTGTRESLSMAPA